MNNNELKKIEPIKYNDFFSIHKTKTISREKINNLPIINSFSRNMNKYFINNHYLFKTHNKSYKNNNDFYSNKNQEFDNNLERVPYPSFLRLSHYIKSTNLKNKTKIINQHSSPNKVNEVYFNINKTEYNQFNRKCFSIEAKNLLKNKNQIRLIKNINKNISVDELLQKEKEEFRKTLNVPELKNKIINEFSYIIYQHFFPYNNYNNHINYQTFNHINKNNLKLKIIKNINDKKKSPLTQRTNDLFKNNTFFEMIIEKVMHLVEYKNQLNQKISINLVKNLLNDEINSMWNNLNTSKNNCSKATAYESGKVNKSTSTDDNFILDYRLNHTYSQYDKYSNTSMSEMDFEKKAKLKLERKLSILNNKYGFDEDNDGIEVNYDLFSNYSYNIDNYSQSETDNIIKSKRKSLSNKDNNLGDFILSLGNNINTNLNEYKKNNTILGDKNIFKTSNIKDLLSQFLTGDFNKQGFKQGLHNFKNIQISDKKNINFNDFQNNIIELYQNFLQMKEIIKQKKQNQINQANKKNNKIFNNSHNSNVPIIVEPNSNINNQNKTKEKKTNIRPTINFDSFDDFFKFINEDEEFESFMNGFGGYYSFGGEKKNKEILQKIKKSKERQNYIYDYSNMKKIQSNINSNRSPLTTKNKGKTSDQNFKDKTKNNNSSNNNNNNNSSNKDENKDNTNNSKSNLINEEGENKEIKEKNDFENQNKEEDNKDRRLSKKKLIEKNDISKNDYLNQLEKEFLKQTNNLKDLDEKDRQQLLKYLNEIDNIMESGNSGSIYAKIKINNLHYLIEKYIRDLLNKSINNTNLKEKATKEIFKLLKNNNFFEKQKRILEQKKEEEEEKEEKESDVENHIKVDSSDNKVDIESMFIKGKRRSRSVDITKFKMYYKVYHKLLFKKIRHKKQFLKSNSAKKNLGKIDWKSFMRKRFKRHKTKKLQTFKKKKRHLFESKYKKNLMTDDLNAIIPVREIYEEDEEIRQFQEDERKKKLRQELIEQKMNDFFSKIQRLKNSDMKNFENELENLVNEQLERIDYSKDKEYEYRRNNFIQDFDLTRTKDLLTKQFKSKRMHYLSPIIFFSKQKGNNKNKKDIK